MSSSKRHRVDSSPSGSDVEEERRGASDRGKAARIKSVGMDENAGVRIVVHGNVVNNLNVRVVKGGGVGVKLETWGRNQRRQKKRKRESSNKEPVSAEKREERRKAAEEKQKKEAAERMEARRQKHNEDNGQNLSLDEFKSMEEEAKQQMRQSGRSSTGGTGQTLIHAFFQPKTGGDDARPSQSGMSTVGVESLVEALAVIEEGGEPGLTSATLTDEQSDNHPTEMMYLRLAFLRKQEIDTMKRSPAAEMIRKTKMIGPVLVEGLDDDTVKVDSAQFQTLSDPNKRNGGKEIGRKMFEALKKALKDADWRVDRKYLSERNREGRNGAWTPAQVQLVIDAVELKAGKDGKPSYKNAMHHLRDTYGKYAGYDWKDITKRKVKYVYENRDKLRGQSSTSKLGRPRLLSEECENALKDFVKATLDGDTSYMLCYYMDRFDQILTEYKEDVAFYDGCRNPTKYLRAIIHQHSGAPRQVTTYSGKGLSIADRLKNTTDNFLRLAYLVRQYGLTENDVYNFDETAVRFHEDATGKVIARKGTKVVRGEAFQRSVDHRLCCTFIPMVSCAGEKFDPALIFKGKKGLTGAIPGDGGKAFQSLYDPEGQRKVCFMQNDAKWSTNQTTTQWFTEHFIPQVHAAKQARRDAGEDVPARYVVILDGVATHCMSGQESESWITKVQAEDPNLILLWLPPNMTDDLQPLDVNFNRPFKAKYRPELARLKMRQNAAEPAIQQQNGRTPRGDSAAQKLKEVVIKAIISTYKSVPKEQVVTGWREAGRKVYEDNRVAARPAGYHSAWDPETQDEAVKAFEAGTLFHEGMRGGVSIVEGPQFIPKAGNKKKEKPTEDATGRVPDGRQEARVGRKKKGPKKVPTAGDGSDARGTARDETVELARPRRRRAGENPHYQDYVDTTEAVQASIQEDAAASSQRYPEHDYSQYLDEFVDSEGEEDEIIEALSDRPVGGETPTQT